jgi:hypothetical protein
MRTMSAFNSRASTPRSGTLGSHRDLHFGSGAGIAGSYSMASGSRRTLERSCPGSFDRPTFDRGSDRASSFDRPTLERSCPGSFDRHHADIDDFYEPPPSGRSSFRTFHTARVNGAGEQTGVGLGQSPKMDINHQSEAVFCSALVFKEILRSLFYLVFCFGSDCIFFFLCFDIFLKH